MKELIKNFERRHNFYKSVTMVSLIGMIGTILVSVYYNNEFAKEKSAETFVAIDGKVYKAIKSESYNYAERKYEIMQAVKEYYINRYSADRYSFEDNIKMALEYCGDCSELVLSEYSQDGIAKNVREWDWTFAAYLDSVVVYDDLSGHAFGRQSIRNNSQHILRNVYISFQARDISRSERNLLGVVFDELDLFNNKVLEIKNLR